MSQDPRTLEISDLAEVVQLCREHAEYERAPWVERADRLLALKALLSAKDAWCWVIEGGVTDGGSRELAGFATMFLERSTWDAAHVMHLDCIYLRPAYRGRGIGKRLMTEAARVAHELGAVNLQWQTPGWNADAVRFYHRLGATSADKLRFTLSREQLALLTEELAEPSLVPRTGPGRPGHTQAPPTAPETADSTHETRTQRTNSSRVGLAAAAVIFLWACSFVCVKLALTDLAPGQLALARYSIAALVFLALLLVRPCARLPLPDLVRMAVAGGVGIALYNVMLNSGQRTVSAGVASLLVNTVPIWTSLLSVTFLKERIGGMQWIGALLSFAGVGLISMEHGGMASFDGGVLLVLAAALSQAAYFVILKPLLARYHPIDITSYAVWFGFGFLLPFHSGLWSALSTSTVTTQASIIFLGVGPAALAYVAWAYVLKQLPAGRAANLLFLIPVVALALGWLVLSEVPTALALLGGSLALAGVALNRRAHR